MGSEVDDGGLHAPVRQILRHLQADEAAAHDDHPLQFAGVHLFPQAVGVIGGAHEEHVLQVHSLALGDKGVGAGGDHQFVIALGEDLAGLQVPGGDGLGGPVQAGDLHAGAYLGAGEGHEGLRSVHHQLVPGLDHVAHVIRQAAAGVGDVLPHGQDPHLCVPLLPLQLGRDLRPRRHAAYDQNLHRYSSNHFYRVMPLRPSINAITCSS